MFGLSTLGLVHTVISLLALGFAAAGLWRHRRLVPQDRAGLVYIVTTALAAVTSLFLFSRGVFGPGHVLAVLTLVALVIGAVAATSKVFGRASPYLQTGAMTATLLFHAVPGVTETLTRLPRQQPLLPADAPQLKAIYGALLVAFIVAVGWQWLRIRKGTHAGAAATMPASRTGGLGRN